jgi:hypothetical protein
MVPDHNRLNEKDDSARAVLPPSDNLSAPRISQLPHTHKTNRLDNTCKPAENVEILRVDKTE